MRNSLKVFLLSALILFGLGKTAVADTIFGDYLKEQGIEVKVSGAVDFYNQYIWRGFQLDKDPVVQPSVTISANGFEGGFWGSWDVDQNDSLASDEVDGWVGYSFDLGFIDEELEMVGVSVGNTWYTFPSTNTDTQESYLTVSLDTLLSPYVTWFYDYGDEADGGADGSYVMVGIGHSFDLIEEYGITFDVGYEFNYNHEAFIVGEGGYNMITWGMTVPLHEGVTMAPSFGYVMPYGDLDDTSDGAQDDEFFAGVSTAFEF